MLEPDLEQAEGRLKCLRFGGGRGLRAEEELLNQARCRADHVRDVLLSELCLTVEAPAQSVSLLPQLRQHSMAELAMEQELLARLLQVCRRLLAGLEGHAPLPLDVLLRELLRVVDAGLVVDS